MRTRTMVLLAAVMVISATTSVFAADSMKHDMQRDLHVRMGMAATEDANVQPTQQKTTITYMNHDMQTDLHVNMGMAATDGVKESVTQFKSSTNESDYRQ
jgi:hypothetical protein